MKLIRFALLAPLLAFSAQAQTLNMGTGGAVNSLDPHYYNATPNSMVALHFFDTLVARDEQARLLPGLAESWRAISDTVWEFRLRSGVKWHDGRDFTADDVAFTIERVPNVPNSPSSFASQVRDIARVEIVDPLTIRFHTERPSPLLPTDLAAVFIVSRHAGAGASTEDYNSGKAIVGTGPFRFAAYRPGDRVEMTRNDAYWGGKPAWERVNYRIISNPAARTAALLSGDVDLIDTVPGADLPRLRTTENVQIRESVGLRLIYIKMDFGDARPVPFVTDNNGQPMAQNPFRDIRVRRAINMAIDRQVLAERIMERTATPTAQWLPAGTYSYNPEVLPPRADPEGARRLLAEAGYPQGFRLTLHTPNDRYPNDARTSQAIAQMLTRIGIQTQVEALPWSAYTSRAAKQEFGFRLIGWASSSGEASNFVVNNVTTYNRETLMGTSNTHFYSNPQIDAALEHALVTMDDAAREVELRKLIAMVADDVAVLPLYQLNNYWAVRRGIDYSPSMDERTLAIRARPVAN